MLIAQIFPVISVYSLCEGQYAYRGNIINFPQDVHEFTTRLPCNPSLLDILIVRHQSASGLTFRDFNVHCTKIAWVLFWLKENNRYYANIDIDNVILQSLPDDGPIDDCLSRLQNMENEHLSDEENETEDIITRNFIPASLPSYHEDDAIENTLARM